MALTIGTLLAKAGLEIDTGSFRSLDTALTNAKTNLQDLSTTSQLAISATLASVPVAIAAIGGAGLSVASNFEDASTTLTTLYGDVDTARGKFQDLSAFAANTPFEFPELLDATVKLKGFGIDAGTYLTTLGDTAAGMGKTIDGAVEALADAQQGEFERLKEFGIKAMEINSKNAEQLGVSADQAGKTAFMYTDKWGKQQVAVVDKNNREMITKTIDGIWNEKYAGAMEQRSKTMSGMLSTLKDNMSMALADLVGFDMQTMEVQAGSLMGTIKSLAGVGTDFTGWISGVSEPVQTFITVVAVATGGVSLLAAGFVAYGAVLPMVTAAQTALGISLTAAIWPVAAGILALGALGAALYVLEEKTGIVSAGFQVFRDVLTITFDGISRLVDWLVTGIKTGAGEIYTYLSNLIPPGLSSALSSIGNTISTIVGGIAGSVHTSAENIRNDGQTVQTSAQGVSDKMGITALSTQTSGGLMSSAFNQVGSTALTMGAQATGATGQMVSGFGASGIAATTMGSQVTGATSQMYTGFVQSSTGADMLQGKLVGIPASVYTLTGAINGGTSANQSYAASFVDISNMASAAASAAVSAASRIGSAIKTSAAQVGNVEALAGKWNTRAKLGTTSSGGKGTGESNVKVIPATASNKTTNTTNNNVTIKTYATESNVTKWVKRATGN